MQYTLRYVSDKRRGGTGKEISPAQPCESIAAAVGIATAEPNYRDGIPIAAEICDDSGTVVMGVECQGTPGETSWRAGWRAGKVKPNFEQRYTIMRLSRPAEEKMMLPKTGGWNNGCTVDMNRRVFELQDRRLKKIASRFYRGAGHGYLTFDILGKFIAGGYLSTSDVRQVDQSIDCRPINKHMSRHRHSEHANPPESIPPGPHDPVGSISIRVNFSCWQACMF